jgi:DNA helicase-2/ATP-dependent DNA helicase PcrA
MNFTPAQQEAIETKAARVAVTAGAGAGKTRVLTHRVARLIGDLGVWPSKILVVTFTRSATAEIRERLEKMVDPERLEGLTVSTIHAWCARLLRQFPRTIGRDQDFTIYDQQDVDDIQKAILSDFGAKQKTWDGATNFYKRDKSIDHDKQQQSEKLIAEYHRRLLSWNAVDYDTLLTGAQQTLKESDEARAAYQYEHILVDEAQDTAPIPWSLFELLNPACLYVVGDARQSIYSFQGARVDDLVGFTQGALSIDLPENFRSLPKIVAYSNGIIGPDFPEMVSARSTDGVENDGTVGSLVDTSREARAERVAHDVADAIDEGIDPESIAVLARTWHSLEPIEEAMRAAGLACSLAKPDSDFWRKPGVRAVFAILRAAVNLRDAHSARQMIDDVQPDHLAYLRTHAARTGMPLALCGNGLADAVNAVRAAADSAAKACATVLEQFKLVATYTATGRTTKAAEASAVVEAVVRWESEGNGKTVVELLDWLTQRDLQERTKEACKGGVYLGTIHSAKGLEWDVVFLLEWTPRGDIEEEWRCYYVGATRARDRLYVLNYDHGNKEPKAGGATG